MNGNNDPGPSKGKAFDRLRKRLYKRNEDFHERKRRFDLTPIHSNVPEDWHKEGEKDIPITPMRTRKRTSPLTLFFIISGLLALVSVVVAAWFVLLGGAGTVSLRGIELTIQAPSEATGGDLVRWEVTIQNKSGKDLETADLIFEYPKNSRPVREGERKTLRIRTSLGVILAGEEIKKTYEGFLFGEEDTKETARATLEYRASGANVILAIETEKKNAYLAFSFDGLDPGTRRGE